MHTKSFEIKYAVLNNAYETLAVDEGESLGRALYAVDEMQEQIYDAGAKNFTKM